MIDHPGLLQYSDLQPGSKSRLNSHSHVIYIAIQQSQKTISINCKPHSWLSQAWKSCHNHNNYFNLHVRQLPLQVHHCFLVSYAYGSTLQKVVPLKWHIEFEPAKLSTLCISLKWGLKDHPYLVIDSISIKEAETLPVLGFHFDRHLIWTAMTDTMVSHSSRAAFGMSAGFWIT